MSLMVSLARLTIRGFNRLEGSRRLYVSKNVREPAGHRDTKVCKLGNTERQRVGAIARYFPIMKVAHSRSAEFVDFPNRL